MPGRRVAVVPHTHWDREWYEPFQVFRARLVELMDALLDLLETDPSYSRYLLDGQMAVVDDYLEVRPENEERLRRHAASGRLAMGPWYILMDEFLVSGETIVRDLQLGIERGAAFGGVAEVGYLPDMFGHVAQMPQILRLAGFEHAVVWRGVPSEITASAFWWRAPDGSTVRAEYLLNGYGSGASLPDDAKAVVARAADHVTTYDSFLHGDVLFMNGSDHLMPQPFLGRVLAEANAIQDDYDFVISSLAEHLDRAPATGLATLQGELRSGCRANVLMGVASNRVDVKLAAARTEHALERRAEPLAALFDATRWPTSLLALAWREVIRNAAHDSICACSVDAVVDAVLHRFTEAKGIADTVAGAALGALGASMRNGGHVAANPSGTPRRGLVELLLASESVDPARTQVLSQRMALPGELVLDATTARTLLATIQGPRLDEHAWIESAEVADAGDETLLTVKIGPFERPGLEFDQVRDALMGKLRAAPDRVVRVRLDQPPIRRVLAVCDEVPALGWRRVEPGALSHPAEAPDEGPATLRNGLVTVEVDATTGTFSIDGHPGFGKLIDGGDLGDSYNYSPPALDTIVDEAAHVSVEVTERGPVRATAVVTATYRWPDHVDGTTQRRVGEHEVELTTTIQVVADEPWVRVHTTFVNPSKDHRLRVELPTVAPATSSTAECAFGTVERGLTAEGRPDEFGLPTFPSRRFVIAGELTVVHQGLHEYEIVGIDERAGHAVAVTLLRSTGMLSRLGMTLRPMPAGPLTPVEGLQLVGRRVDATYAVGLGVEDPWVMCDHILSPLEVTTSQGGGHREDEGAALICTGARISSVQLADGLLEVRVFNPTDEPTTVSLAGRRGWEVDLRGRFLAAFEESLVLRPRGIATLRLEPDQPTSR